jgi:hypothetical protein
MPGSLFDIIKRDAKFMINKAGYQVEIEMITPDGSQTINITGWAVKVSGSFDSDGNQVNTKNVHITIDEDVLIGLGYPYKTTKKGSSIPEIDLIHHRVNYIDSSGRLCNYYVRENFPDENLGLINVGLGDLKKT